MRAYAYSMQCTEHRYGIPQPRKLLLSRPPPPISPRAHYPLVIPVSPLAAFLPQALDMPFPYMAAKMYLYYEDTWWIYMNL